MKTVLDTNVFTSIPENPESEVLDELFQRDDLRIERIVSKGHTSPQSGWYDQEENEWVVVLEGAGTIEFVDGSKAELGKGDHIHIPAHKKHKVVWTDPDRVTIWLAVFFK